MKNFLLGLFGLAIVTFSVIYVVTDHKFTVVHFAEVKQDGYGMVSPETFKVEISPNLAFKFAHQHLTIGLVIACIILVASLVWVIIASTESINFGKYNEAIYKKSGQIWFALVTISIIIFFINHGSVLGNNYLNLDRTNYVNIRGNDEVTPFRNEVIEDLFKTKENIIK